ncbi:MAG: aldehyde dehydrogenase (NADP(+)), partial [bacterium]
TIGQLRMFAQVVLEGSWLRARIDRAQPDRKPLPKPDLRSMLVPIGPVAVFGASNFPFAYSTAGGDTASALAAGCPVIVKAHPSHPRTSDLVASAVAAAARASGLPAGVFGHVQGGPDAGLALVRHPGVKGVGFTGSLRAGRALFDAAAARPEPIPVFAEMGSVNPVVLLPSALERDAAGLASALAQSATLGAGQFCTNPGLVLMVDGPPAKELVSALAGKIAAVPPASMLSPAIRASFATGAERMAAVPGVGIAARSASAGDAAKNESGATAFTVSGRDFLAHPDLREEVFGPSTLVILCADLAELRAVVASLPGQLTGSLHGSEDELSRHGDLVALLRERVGRLVFGGFPTGVEVCAAMQHGGPYPATTDSRFSSVGSGAILRWARPVSYQNCPPSLLPPELRNANPLGLLRLVDGAWSSSPIG